MSEKDEKISENQKKSLSSITIKIFGEGDFKTLSFPKAVKDEAASSEEIYSYFNSIHSDCKKNPAFQLEIQGSETEKDSLKIQIWEVFQRLANSFSEKIKKDSILHPNIHQISPYPLYIPNQGQQEIIGKEILIIDCETNGLYGEYLSVAFLMKKADSKVPCEAFYIKRNDIEELSELNPFVKENVLAQLNLRDLPDYDKLLKEVSISGVNPSGNGNIPLTTYEVQGEEELISKSKEIIKYFVDGIPEKKNLCILAESPYPVEFLFLNKIISSSKNNYLDNNQIAIALTDWYSIKQKEQFISQERKYERSRHNALIDTLVIYREIEELQRSKAKVFSHHVFILPFKISNLAQGDNFPNKDKDFSWKEEFIDGDIDDLATAKEKYMIMRYFNKETGNILYNQENNSTKHQASKNQKQTEKLILNYIFQPEERTNNQESYYHIYIDENTVYSLDLKKIRLRKNPKTETYLLMIYTENRKYLEPNDIKKINQYGRRLYSPWIPEGNSECPDGIGITIGDHYIPASEYERDFWKQNLNYKTKEVISEQNYLAEIKKYIAEPQKAEFVSGLLNYDRQQISESTKLQYESSIDDRMFVCFLIKDDNLLKRIATFDAGKSKYSYQYDSEASKELYSIIYIDNADATCQSLNMRNKLLDKAIYDRWIDWKTIHTITQHSMGCLTTNGAPEDAVIKPFLIEYVEMAAIVLMQRSSLLAFSLEAGEKSRHLDIKELQELQKKYILFKNQFLLFEVTPQEQGYELYRKLQEELYVFEEKSQLDDQLQSIYEMANVQQDQLLNDLAGKIGFAGIILALISVIWDRLPILSDTCTFFTRNRVVNLSYIIFLMLISLAVGCLWNALKLYCNYNKKK